MKKKHQMILLVNAMNETGQKLRYLNGPTVPYWGGEGNPQEGYYAGLPGNGFAKILEETWLRIKPSGSYWNHTRIVSDNRIPAMSTDRSSYEFQIPTDSDLITIEVSLLFRRVFIELAQQKSWGDEDLIIAQKIWNIDINN